jgi:hypothetical protein
VSPIDLHLGPLRAERYNIFRSGVRWLCESGQYCRANQVFAYCNVNLEPVDGRFGGPPFAEELVLQIAFAPRAGGRIVINSSAARGGYLSVRTVDAWDANDVVSALDRDPDASDAEDSSRLRLLALAGRRMTALADTHSGLLPGWQGRSRGWWCEEGETPVTLLSLGVCDATGPKATHRDSDRQVQENHVGWLVRQTMKGQIGCDEALRRLVQAFRRHGGRHSTSLLFSGIAQLFRPRT